MSFTRVSVGSIEFTIDEDKEYFDARAFCDDHNCDIDEWTELNSGLIDWFRANRTDPILYEDYYHKSFLPLIAIWCDPMYFGDIQDYYMKEPEFQYEGDSMDFSW